MLSYRTMESLAEMTKTAESPFTQSTGTQTDSCDVEMTPNLPTVFSLASLGPICRFMKGASLEIVPLWHDKHTSTEGLHPSSSEPAQHSSRCPGSGLNTCVARADLCADCDWPACPRTRQPLGCTHETSSDGHQCSLRNGVFRCWNHSGGPHDTSKSACMSQTVQHEDKCGNASGGNPKSDVPPFEDADRGEAWINDQVCVSDDDDTEDDVVMIKRQPTRLLGTMDDIQLLPKRNRSIHPRVVNVKVTFADGLQETLRVVAKDSEEGRVFQCTICTRTYKTGVALHNHTKQKHREGLAFMLLVRNQEKRVVCCWNCDFVAVRSSIVLFHFDSCHGLNYFSLDNPGIIDTDKAYICEICKAIQLDCNKLMHHIISKHKDLLKVHDGFISMSEVDRAEVEGRRARAVRDPLLTRTSNTVFVCLLCSFRTNVRNDRVRFTHMIQQHRCEALLYLCSECPARFQVESGMAQHWNTRHSGATMCYFMTTARMNSKQPATRRSLRHRGAKRFKTDGTFENTVVIDWYVLLVLEVNSSLCHCIMIAL